jgi:hypothetical protein
MHVVTDQIMINFDDPNSDSGLYFIRSAGLIKGYSKGEAQWIIEGHGARAGLLWSTPHTFIQTTDWYQIALLPYFSAAVASRMQDSKFSLLM